MLVINRKDSGGEKCPRCSRIGVDFIDVGNGVWACFDCGCLFVTKKERVRVRVASREKIFPEHFESTASVDAVAWSAPVESTPVESTPVEVPAEPTGYPCEICGKVLKSKLGLTGHLRTHKEAA
jgi:ribosomal protein L37AE/L43A